MSNTHTVYFVDSDINTPAVGTKLEGLLIEELEDDFNPRAYENNSSTQNFIANNGNSSSNTSSPPPLCKY